MKKEKQVPLETMDALMDAQMRHAKLLKKIEKARARLEKANRKLWVLESKIANLVHQNNNSHAQPPAHTTPGAGIRSARLIFNPKSKGALDGTFRLEEIVSYLRSYRFDVEIGVKTTGDAVRELTKEAVKRETDLVIVAAGDGTIEDVIDPLIRTKTALGIIPIGTMNNIARSLGVPLNLKDACDLLGMGTTRYIDVGRVITHDKPQGVHFLESAGVGLSALSVPIGQDEEKGRWVLLLGALGKALLFKGANVTITCDNSVVVHLHTQVVTISNAPLFGKNMLIAPDAKLDDGLLDVAIYDDMGKLELERHFLAIADGKRVDNPRVSFRRVQHVCVTSDEILEATADLRVLAGQQVWDIDILPRSLKVVAGKGIALTLPVDVVPSVPPLSGPQPSRNPVNSQELILTVLTAPST